MTMFYPEDIEKRIDFSVIRQELLSYCSFPISAEKVRDMHFLTDENAISLLLAQGREMLNILQDASIAIPACQLYDLRESLSRIRIDGLFLDESELSALRDALSSVVAYAHFFQNLDPQRFPLLSHFAEQQTNLKGLTNLAAAIDRLLDRYGQLKDNASPELAAIRQEKRKSENAVSKILHSILRKAQAEGIIDSDTAPALREGRLVLPVSPQYKRKFGGIVHDESQTGKTVFVEPQEVVDANNRIRELEGDERRERIRILTVFTTQIRPLLHDIQLSQQFLGEVDYLLAKATYARSMGAISPNVINQPVIDLREARHPVLMMSLAKQGKEVVPLTLKLTDKQRILMISGPNAGGKSVCLKTVALLQYMLQCGLLIPVREDSTMGLFNDILLDIGDQQSIADDLSTYSSHLRNMKVFVQKANANSLILIDEFGGGTEPNIGGAIAEAVLTALNQKRVKGIITTHYGNLKHFAEQTEGIVNGAMLYDRGKLRPLFQLSIGQAGSSFAIEIAHQIGLPDEIIQNAKELVGEEHIDYEKSLADIARDKRYWEQKRQHVRQREKHLEEKIEYYEEQIARLKQTKREMLAEAKEEAEQLLKKSNAEIEKTIRVIRETGADKEQTRQAREELQQFKESVQKTDNQPIRRPKNPKNPNPKTPTPPKLPNTQTLEIGCMARSKRSGLIGQITAINGNKTTLIIGNLQSQIALKDLEYVSKTQAKKPQVRISAPSNVSETLRQKQLHFTHELDLRGMRADEALQRLQSYIDDALMVNTERVTVLHGTGTGALRQVVRNYLQQLHQIHAFHDAHPDQGGAGITVVEFN